MYKTGQGSINDVNVQEIQCGGAFRATIVDVEKQ